MKILKFTLLVLLFEGLFYNAFGQTEKNNFIIGTGSKLDFNAQNEKYPDSTANGSSSHSFTINPYVGFFIINNLAAGIEILYNKSSSIWASDSDRYFSTSYGLGPFARYYLGRNMIRPFVQGGLKFTRENYRTDFPGDYGKTKGHYNTIDYDLDLGMAYFINNKISLDFKIGYNAEKRKDNQPGGSANERIQNIGLSIAFNFLLL